MSDCRTMTREFLREFVEMYREQPCLWQTKSKEYLDKNKKNEAYKMLVKKLQSVQPNATKTTVINKINTLRGGFRREWKKVRNSKRSGTGSEDVYVPSLWYYDLFLFVRDQDTPRESVTNIPSEDNEDNYYENSQLDEEGGNSAETENETNDDCGDIQNQSESPAHLEKDLHSPSTSAMSNSTQDSLVANSELFTPSSNKRFKTRKCPPVVDKVDKILNVVSARLNNPDDEFSIIGKNIALKLRKLPKDTKIYTEKLINDLLFQAELGKITEHTRITYEIIQPTPRSNTFDRLQRNSEWNRSAFNNDYQFPNFDHSSQNIATSTYYSTFNPAHDDVYNNDH